MAHKFDITLILKKEEIDEINKEIKNKNDEFAYQKFRCVNTSLRGYATSFSCSGCKYMYKIDVTKPGLFGCHVKDYIDQIKSTLVDI